MAGYPAAMSKFTPRAISTPADHAHSNLPYEEWLDETIGQPDLSCDGSVVVLVDGTPAALSWLLVDPARGLAEHEFTGTGRAFRRRGLGRVAKLAALRWAADHGVTRVVTGNDATNVGMLAINDAVGFRPSGSETEWVKPIE